MSRETLKLLVTEFFVSVDHPSCIDFVASSSALRVALAETHPEEPDTVADADTKALRVVVFCLV